MRQKDDIPLLIGPPVIRGLLTEPRVSLVGFLRSQCREVLINRRVQVQANPVVGQHGVQVRRARGARLSTLLSGVARIGQISEGVDDGLPAPATGARQGLKTQALRASELIETLLKLVTPKRLLLSVRVTRC